MKSYDNRGGRKFRKAIFLDRDGVFNRDIGQPHLKAQYHPYQCMPEAIRKLSALDAHIIIVTNQSGIAVNRYDTAAFEAFNRLIIDDVEAAGGRIDAVYYCPHYDWYNLPEGTERCNCSKPNPGMLLEAAGDFDLDLSQSIMIGDNYTDIGTGQNAGVKATILVTTGSWYINGNYREEPLRTVHVPTYTVHSLMEAADAVIDNGLI